MSVSRIRAVVLAGLVGLIAAAGFEAGAVAQGISTGVVQQLPLDREIDSAGAGALDPATARLPATLWNGSGRADVVRLAAALPARMGSPALRDLVQRVLAVAGKPPDGAPVSPGVAEARAAALLRLGDAGLAANLLAAVPRSQRDEAADLLLLDASLLTQDRALACAVARGRAGRADAMAFAKTAAFCEALAGDRGRAEFAAALVAERAPDDTAFFQLLDLMTGAVAKPGRAIEKLRNPSVLHRAMMRAVGLPPLQSLGDGSAADAVAVERMIAIDPGASLGQRTEAAWRALHANAADVPAARQLFLAAGASGEGGKGAAGKIAGLYAKCAAAAPGPDRALALALLLTEAEAEGAVAQIAALARPMLADLLALASGPDVAGRIARGLLLAEEANVAARWQASLRAAAVVPGATDAALRLVEVGALATGADTRLFGGPEASLWLGAVGRAVAQDRNAAMAQAGLYAALRQAVGLPVPAALVLAGTAWRPADAMAPLILAPLMAAADAGLVGETALRAAHLVEVESIGTRPWRMAEAAAALGRVGLKREARQLAVEAAVAGGL